VNDVECPYNVECPYCGAKINLDGNDTDGMCEGDVYEAVMKNRYRKERCQMGYHAVKCPHCHRVISEKQFKADIERDGDTALHVCRCGQTIMIERDARVIYWAHKW